MNVILLPKADFAVHTSADGKSHHTASITELNQLAHIKNVLKCGINDPIKIGQLGGNLGVARIAHMTDTTIMLDKVTLTQPPPPKLGVSVILALPRPKVLRRLIIDMTALGVNDIILVNSHRSQKSYWQSPLLKRVPEFIQEGLQQAVDTIAPNVYFKKRLRPFVEDDLSGMIAQFNGQSGHQCLFKSSQLGKALPTQMSSLVTRRFYPTAMIAHPYADNELVNLLVSLHTHDNALKPYVLAIGAEGGWTDFEVALFVRYGFVAMRHGQRILRTEAVVNGILGSFIH